MTRPYVRLGAVLHLSADTLVTTDTRLPAELRDPLVAAGLEAAASNVEAWLQAQRLVLVRTNAPIIETFQVVIPVRPAHPLLTLQPPPNNPDVPTQKMWALKRSPYSNSGPRQALVDALNRGLPERDQKGADARDRMFKLRWALFAEDATFAHIQAVLNDVITKVRSGARRGGAA